MQLFLVIVCAPLLVAQTSSLRFEVATIKQSPPVKSMGDVSAVGGPGTSSPELFRYRGARLPELLANVYGLIDAQTQISGPDWIRVQRYEIAGTMPKGTSKAQFHEMLRNLLIERLHLQVRIEKIELQVLTLTTGRTLKVKPSPELSEEVHVQPAGADNDGFPAVPTGWSGMAMRRGTGPSGQTIMNWRFGRQSIEQFAGMASSLLGRRVVDRTGLAGLFDFTFYYDPPTTGATGQPIPDHPVVTVEDAIEQQLGLRLTETKQLFDRVVIESGSPEPDEN